MKTYRIITRKRLEAAFSVRIPSRSKSSASRSKSSTSRSPRTFERAQTVRDTDICAFTSDAPVDDARETEPRRLVQRGR